jgi:hypothetical protein
MSGVTEQRTLSDDTSARRAGYLVGASANALLLGAIHGWPGWQVVPFLTAETPTVLGAVDAMLVAGIVVNLLHLVRDPSWLRPVGVLVTTAFGLLATVRVLRVFPFAFGPGFDWSPVVRALLVLGVIGSVVGLVIAVVQLSRLRSVTRG